MHPFKTDSSLYSFECPLISDEEFNMFHSIDRELFTILLHAVGCDPDVAMQVVALFIWLENQCVDIHLIRTMVNLPVSMLRRLVDEGALCLKSAESDNFVFGGAIGIRLLPEFMDNPFLSLGFFHENRIAVLKGVSDITENVCERAFRDILQRRFEAGPASRRGGVPPVHASEVAESSRMGEMRKLVGGGGMEVPPFVLPQHPMHALQGDMWARLGVVPPVQFVGESSRMVEMRNEVGIGRGSVFGMPHLPLQQVMSYDPYLTAPVIQHLPGGQGSLLWLPAPRLPTPHVVAPRPLGHNVPTMEHGMGLPMHTLRVERFPVHDSEGQREEQGDVSRRDLVTGNREGVESVTEEETTGVAVEEEAEAEEFVPPEDRTIFLTFSRGYPVSEEEVRDFFTRRFGDFIEDVIMQDVRPGEQVIYARMVARSASVIPGITEGSRVRYTINGKHVMARKFVSSRQNSSVGQSSSSQQAQGPAE